MTNQELEHPNPESILQLGLGFWASKTLLSAIELGVFTQLATGPLNGDALAEKLALHPRAARDFFDALVALGMLQKNGHGYENTPSTNVFLDRNKPSYVGGLFEMANARLYGFWGSLTEALRTGQPQNEAKTGGPKLFDAIYSDPAKLQGFLKAMTGVSMGSAMAIAAKFPWSEYKTFIDLGCAEGCVPVAVARQHPHLTGGGFDLPVVKPHFENYVAANGLSDRVKFTAGDFFNDELPSADVLIFGHILHDWDLEEKKRLLEKAYRALPEGGAVIVYEAIIDDDRSKNAFGLLMSLNMLIETPGGFDYTGSDCMQWMREVGFRETRVEHLVGPDSMVVGVK
ncbi:MAG: methyltransferase [Acidobacteria bacterium]|nr:MAG: methyltransferase [Acidobacteriota bacterium]